MKALSYIAGLAAFVLILLGIFWIGFYIVLPIVLLFVVVSFIVSLTKNFVPQKAHKSPSHHAQSRVIDVEFEEIK